MSARPPNVTIKDVARASGVSPMTVSRVINYDRRVRPETRRRVEAAIAELGYVPSRLARGLSGHKTGTIALIVPDVANPFFTDVAPIRVVLNVDTGITGCTTAFGLLTAAGFTTGVPVLGGVLVVTDTVLAGAGTGSTATGAGAATSAGADSAGAETGVEGKIAGTGAGSAASDLP